MGEHLTNRDLPYSLFVEMALLLKAAEPRVRQNKEEAILWN